MREYIQEFEKNGTKATMYFNFKTDRYEIDGYGMQTLRFTDIYDAYEYMRKNDWK